ncbi:hypothetical protein PFISCL1PPCAC_27800, partial [Pristionchus fissidentatus]
DEDEEEEEQPGTSTDEQPPRKKRRTKEIARGSSMEANEEEETMEYNGDSTLLRQPPAEDDPLSLKRLRREKVTKTQGQGSKIVIQSMYTIRVCAYCSGSYDGEAALIEHVKTTHYDEWKKYATFKCKWFPHCDFRTTKKYFMEVHRKEAHDDLYKSWLVDERMKLADGKCPFCSIPVSSIHQFHKHLEENHQHSAGIAFKKNMPFIGCGSCDFSAYWATDVHDHWRERPNCGKPLVLRELQLSVLAAEVLETRRREVELQRAQNALKSKPRSSVRPAAPRTKQLLDEAHKQRIDDGQLKSVGAKAKAPEDSMELCFASAVIQQSSRVAAAQNTMYAAAAAFVQQPSPSGLDTTLPTSATNSSDVVIKEEEQYEEDVYIKEEEMFDSADQN